MKKSTIPYSFDYGDIVLYNNEVHLLGGSSSNKHYKWDGSKWTKVSTLPYVFYQGSAVVYNNEIHILGGGEGELRTYHYKWNGSSWTSVSTLPVQIPNGGKNVINFKNYINLFYSTSHYILQEVIFKKA